MKPTDGNGRNLAEHVEPSDLRRSWSRLPTESRRAFSAFCLYRDSPDRRLSNVAKGLNPPCSVPNVSRWSAKHDWQRRAADYDSYVDEMNRQEMARSRTEIRKRRLQVARALEGLGSHALREWMQRVEQKLPLNLSPETIAFLAKTAATLQEQALGPEHESKFTQIVVRVGDHEYPDEGESTTEPTTIKDEKKQLLN